MNFSHLEQFLQSLSDTYGIPGASCRIWHQHKEVFSFNVGVRDITTGEAMHGNEQIDFYSASKPVTAVAAMQLMEKYYELGYEVEDCPPPEGYKDYNEWLVENKKKVCQKVAHFSERCVKK